MSMHHVHKMANGNDIEMWIRASAGNVATQLVHDSGNLPSSFGSSRDECAALAPPDALRDVSLRVFVWPSDPRGVAEASSAEQP